MLPDRVSNPGPLTYESGALPIALRGPAIWNCEVYVVWASGNSSSTLEGILNSQTKTRGSMT